MRMRRLFNRLWRAEVRRRKLLTIEDLIRRDGREPGGQSTTTIWAGKWGKPMHRIPDDGKSQPLFRRGVIVK